MVRKPVDRLKGRLVNPLRSHRRAHQLGRQHQMFRPTVAAVMLLLVAAICMVLGLSFDDRVLLAVSVALISLIVLSCIMTIVQWTLWSSSLFNTTSSANPRYVDLVHTGNRRQRLMLPRNAKPVEQWIQINHRGLLVQRFRGVLPRQRGLFHLESLMVCWTDPFGLYKARKRVKHHIDEVMLLPDIEYDRTPSSKVAHTLASGQHQGMNGVRQYEFGDSPRMIAWKYTAHFGSLMTRETNQETVSDTLWVVDPADADVESCVREVLRHLDSTTSRHGGNFYSDGTGIYLDTKSIMRQLAAVQTIAADGSTLESASGDGAGEQAWSTLPEVIENFTHGSKPHPLILIVSTRASEDITSMMASSRQGEAYRLVRPQVSDDEILQAGAERQEGSSSDLHSVHEFPRRDSNTVQHVDAQSTAMSKSTRPTQGMLRMVTGTASLWALAATTIITLSQLFSTQGVWWTYFAGVSFALVALDSILAAQHSAHSLVKALLSSISIVIAAFLAVVFRIHASSGYWLFIPHTEQIAVPAGSVGEDWESVTTTLWDVLVRGFAHVYAQYPPVQINADSDALLIVAVASILVLFRIMLVQIRLAPVVALLPVAVMSMTYQVTGQAPYTWVIILVLAAGALLIWTTATSEIHPITPLTMSVFVVTVSMALLTPMMVVARAVTIPIASNAGLFSSGTINPMVDLKRGLQEGSNSTVLTYRASQGVYLRLSTLDNFNGDTWSFSSSTSTTSDEFTSSTGSMYTQVGDGYLLRNNDSGDIIWVSPLMKYMVADVDDSNSGRYITSPNDDNHYILDSSITIESLQTRFLPLPGEAIRASGAANDGNWRRDADGVFRNNLESTSSGMQYRIQSVYLQPLTQVSDFRRLSEVRAELTERKQRLADNADSTGTSADSSSWSSTFDDRTVDDTGTGKRLRQQYGTLPSVLPASVRGVINQAKRQGVSTDGDSASSQLDAMRYLVNYFNQSDFVYSLDEPDGNGRDNMTMVGGFLRSKSGYCVHYASALAVLGRGMGLSTRMVLGYTPGESTGTGNYTVAAKQLHAWVEVYIDGIGWVPFDVTPSTTNADTASDATSADTSIPTQNTPTQSPTTSTTTPTPSNSSSNQSETESADAQRNAESGTSATANDANSLRILAALGIVLLIAVLLLCITLPLIVRTRRRDHRYQLLSHYLAESSNSAVDNKSGTPDGIIPNDTTAVQDSTAPQQQSASEARTTDQGAVWIALWHEIVDTALDAGMVVSDKLSDAELAQRLTEIIMENPSGEKTQNNDEAKQALKDIPSERSLELLNRIAQGAVWGMFSAHRGVFMPSSSTEHSPDKEADFLSSDTPVSQLPTRDEVEGLRRLLVSRIFESQRQSMLWIYRLRFTMLPKSVFQ